MPVKGLPFAKGHGTGNDFIVVPDPDGEVDLTAAQVAALCDRRRGLGADGVLRVVRAGVLDPTASAEWFMDYRNADGSLAELCGNGVRVYARYLVEAGLAAGPTIEILTRAGTVTARVADDVVAVDMPVPVLVGSGAARLSTVDYPGRVVRCGNPNLVCRVDDPATLDLTRPVSLDPDELPDGANVEFVGPTEFVDDHPRVAMRVVERGVGETLSCGSGACAVAAAVLADAGRVAGPVVVDVPGGRLRVAVGPASCVLTGPAVIVAAGEVRLWESG